MSFNNDIWYVPKSHNYKFVNNNKQPQATNTCKSAYNFLILCRLTMKFGILTICA